MNILEALLYLTLNVYHESRGEDQLGQIAVAHVTLNRSKLRGLSIKETVLEPAQFSWTHELESYVPNDPQAFIQSLESAVVAISGHDFTGGATYYHQKDKRPYWADSYVHVGLIDNHEFYRE